MLHKTSEVVLIPDARQTANNPSTVNPISIAPANRRNSLASGRQFTCWKNGSAAIFIMNKTPKVLDNFSPGLELATTLGVNDSTYK